MKIGPEGNLVLEPGETLGPRPSLSDVDYQAMKSQDEEFARRHEERTRISDLRDSLTQPEVDKRAAILFDSPGVARIVEVPQTRPDRPEDVPVAGVKFDRGKPQLSRLPIEWIAELAIEVEKAEARGDVVRLDLVPPDILVELAALYGRGALKYADRNWEMGFAWSRSYNANFRHLKDFWGGEDIDPETNASHPVAMIWNAVALAWFLRHRPEYDDRPDPHQEKTAA